MFIAILQNRWTIARKTVASFVALFAFVSPVEYVRAQQTAGLPSPGTILVPTPVYHPALIKGLKIYPDSLLKFDFIIDEGEHATDTAATKLEFQKLIKYFFTSLTVPKNDMWVNLFPYESDRVIPEAYGQTEMGPCYSAL